MEKMKFGIIGMRLTGYCATRQNIYQIIIQSLKKNHLQKERKLFETTQIVVTEFSLSH